MSDLYWVNDASTGLWHNSNNWASTPGGTGGAGIPGTGDIAHFTSDCNDNCSLDNHITVGGLDIASGYGGKFDALSYNVTGDDGANFQLDISYSLDMGSGTWSLTNGDFDTTNATAYKINGETSTIEFNGTCKWNITQAHNYAHHNFKVNSGAVVEKPTTSYYYFNFSGCMTITGKLIFYHSDVIYLQGTSAELKLQSGGEIYIGSAAFSWQILLIGTGNFPGITEWASDFTLTNAGGASLDICTTTPGTHSCNLATANAQDVEMDIYTQAASGTLTIRFGSGVHNFGEVRFRTSGTAGNLVLDLSTNDVTSVSVETELDWYISSGGNIEVDATGKSPVWYLSGIVKDSMTGVGALIWKSGNANPEIVSDGTANVTWDWDNVSIGPVEMDKPSGYLRLTDDFHCESLTLTDGQFIPYGVTITVDEDCDIASGVTFGELAGSIWNIGGDWTADGNTMTGTSTWYLNVAGSTWAAGTGYVSYSDASGGSPIYAFDGPWTDGDNNDNWLFSMPFSLSVSTSWLPDYCLSYSLTPYGRLPIGVDQPPGTGDNYPFVRPSDDLEKLFGDLYLYYKDDNCLLQPPFRIEWIYGFGCEPVVHVPEYIPDIDRYHMVIKDSNGEVVYDTRQADSYRRVAWGPRAWLAEWWSSQQLLRAVVYIPGENDVPNDFPNFLRPTNAVLDARVYTQIPPRLNSLSVENQPSSSISSGSSFGRIAAGYNTDLQLQAANETDGARRVSTISVSMEPGLGLGRYVLDCSGVAQWGIKRINRIDPTEYHNFFITPEEDNSCLRVERPWQQRLADVDNCRSAKIRAAALNVDSDCNPCCSCNDFISVYESVRNLSAVLSDYVERAHAVRDWLEESISRVEQQRTCREANKLRAYLQPECPDKAGGSIAYCNGTGDCIKHVILPISFNYKDTLYPTIATATKYTGIVRGQPGVPYDICDYTKRAGNVPDIQNYQLAVPYVLGGRYPHFWAYFDAIEAYSMGFITFFIDFPNSKKGDYASFVVDAYSLPEPPVVSPDEDTLPVLTDYGYVIGQGPSSSSDPVIAWRLVNHPVLAGGNLTQRPCCDEDE